MVDIHHKGSILDLKNKQTNSGLEDTIVMLPS